MTTQKIKKEKIFLDPAAAQAKRSTRTGPAAAAKIAGSKAKSSPTCCT